MTPLWYQNKADALVHAWRMNYGDDPLEAAVVLDVFPHSTNDDALHAVRCESEALTDLHVVSSSGVQCSNLQHLLDRHLGLPITFAGGRASAPTASRGTVSVVLNGRADVQVMRVAARRIVAGVTNHLAFRNRHRVCKRPSNAMCASRASVRTETAVAFDREIPFPRPTLVRPLHIDQRPETCDCLFVHGKPPLGQVPGRVAATRGLSTCSMKEAA